MTGCLRYARRGAVRERQRQNQFRRTDIDVYADVSINFLAEMDEARARDDDEHAMITALPKHSALSVPPSWCGIDL